MRAQECRVLGDDEVAALGTADMSGEDDLHGHFQALAPDDWPDCSFEGQRLLGLMLGEDVEDGSPEADILSAVAAESYACALRHIAAVLGVPAGRLGDIAGEVGRDDLPNEYRNAVEGIGIDGLRGILENYEAWCEGTWLTGAASPR